MHFLFWPLFLLLVVLWGVSPCVSLSFPCNSGIGIRSAIPLSRRNLLYRSVICSGVEGNLLR